MRSSIILYILASLFLLTECSTAPDFERANENDPGSSTFNIPSPSGPNYTFDSDGNLVIHWEDNTDFEDGYQVYKKLGTNSESILIAELDKNTVTYTDDSKNYSYPTIYQVISQVNNKSSDTLTIKIDFGKISDLTSELSDDYETINFSWKSNFEITDGYLLQISDQDDTFQTIHTIEADQRSIRIPNPQQNLSQNFRLVPYLVVEGDTITDYKSNITTTYLKPEELNLTLISYDSLNISWKDFISFEDGYKIRIKNGTETVEYQTDENTTKLNVEGKFNYNDHIEVIVQALYGQFLSESSKKLLIIDEDPIQLESIENHNQNSITLHLSDPSNIDRPKQIWRKTQFGQFELIGELDTDQLSFTETNLDQETIYSYYITSPLSENSESFEIDYHLRFKKIDRITESELEANLIIGLTPVGVNRYSDKVVYLKKRGNNEIIIYDLSNKTILKRFAAPDNISQLIFDKNEEYIYITFGGSSTISIYDFDSGTLLKSLNLSYENIGDIVLDGHGNLITSVSNNGLDWAVVSVNLSDLSETVIYEVVSDGYQPKIIVSNNQEKLVLVYQVDNLMNYEYYTINGSFDYLGGKTNDFYTTTFTDNLDTAFVTTNGDIEIYDLFTGTKLSTIQHYDIYNSHESNSLIILQGLVVYQSESCTYLFEFSNPSNPILDRLCDDSIASTGYGGLHYITKDQIIVDSRISYSSDFDSYLFLLKIEKQWGIEKE